MLLKHGLLVEKQIPSNHFTIQIPAILRAGSSTSILEPKSNYEDDTYPMSFQNETFNSLLKMSKYTGL